MKQDNYFWAGFYNELEKNAGVLDKIKSLMKASKGKNSNQLRLDYSNFWRRVQGAPTI